MKFTYQLQITDEFTTTIEVTGHNKATDCVVFSHGFGVGRDSRGMFTDIEQELKTDFICVRFDYAEILENGNTKIDSFCPNAKNSCGSRATHTRTI